MGYHVVGELVLLDQTVMDRAHMETLDQNLLTSVGYIFEDRQHLFIFQRENAPPLCAHGTEQWLENNDI